MGKLIRDTTQSKEEWFSSSRYKKILVDEDRYVGQDEDDIDKGDCAGWILVSQGDHLTCRIEDAIEYHRIWNSNWHIN